MRELALLPNFEDDNEFLHRRISMTTAKAKAAPKAAPEAAKDTKDAFAFSSAQFDALAPAFKEFTDESLAKSKEVFENFKTASEEAKAVFETTFEKTRNNAIELNEKTMSVAEVNSKAAMDHVKEVMSVKTFADALELQTAFVKKQMAVFQDQSKTLQEMTAHATQETIEPYKAAFEKSMSAFKAA